MFVTKPARRPWPALTVWQPYAGLIAAGRKDVENRGWRAPKRLVGERFCVHAALRAADVELDGGVHPDARQAIIGVVTLIDCVRDDSSTWAHPDQWHWKLGEAVALAEPVECRGRMGVWTVPVEVSAKVTDQLLAQQCVRFRF